MNLFDKIEAKRQEMNAQRDKSGVGTFKGLAEVIQRRRMAALAAQEKTSKPKQEISNAK